MKLHIVIDLGWAAPVLRLMRDGALRPAGSRVLRGLCQFLHPNDPPRVHLIAARALAYMEARP